MEKSEKSVAMLWYLSPGSEGHSAIISSLSRRLQERGYDVVIVTDVTTQQNMKDFDFGKPREVVTYPVMKRYTDPKRPAIDPPLTDHELRFEKPAVEKVAGKIVLDTFKKYSPKVIITELWPAGRQFSAPMLERVMKEMTEDKARPSLRFSFVRDDKPYTSSDYFARIIKRYINGHVLVHGDGQLVPYEKEYLDALREQGVDPDEKMVYCGYTTGRVLRRDPKIPDDQREVLVSAGTGGTSVVDILRGAMNAQPHSKLKDRTWRIMVSQRIPEEVFRALQKEAKEISPEGKIILQRNVHSEEFGKMVVNAAMFITHGGYSNTLQRATSRAPMVIVPMLDDPKVPEKREQFIRTEKLVKNRYASSAEMEALPKTAKDAEAAKKFARLIDENYDRGIRPEHVEGLVDIGYHGTRNAAFQIQNDQRRFFGSTRTSPRVIEAEALDRGQLLQMLREGGGTKAGDKPEDLQIERIPTGMSRTMFRVTLKEQAFILAVHDPALQSPKPGTLSATHLTEFTDLLGQAGLPVSGLVGPSFAPKGHNKLVAQFETSLPGTHVYRMSATQAAELGTAVAKIHNLGTQFAQRYHLKAQFASHGERLDMQKMPTGVLHGDLAAGNVLYTEKGLSGIIDFERARVAPLADDVAYALLSTFTLGRDKHDRTIYDVNKPAVESFLKAYATEREIPISKEEAQYIKQQWHDRSRHWIIDAKGKPDWELDYLKQPQIEGMREKISQDIQATGVENFLQGKQGRQAG